MKGGQRTTFVFFRDFVSRFILVVISLASSRVSGFIFQFPIISFLNFLMSFIVTRDYCTSCQVEIFHPPEGPEEKSVSARPSSYIRLADTLFSSGPSGGW